MLISIIIKIFDIEEFQKDLNNLIDLPISDHLEIIYLYENIEKAADLYKEYYEKFFDIKYIDADCKNPLFASIDEATGEYILLTDSNQLENIYLKEDFLEKMYNHVSKNQIDVLIYNINKMQVETKNYGFLNDFTEKCLNYNDFTKDQLLSLCNLDCDIIFLNNFKSFDSEYIDIYQLDIFLLKTFLNSNKIYILNDFSENKTYENKDNNQINNYSICSKIPYVISIIVDVPDENILKSSLDNLYNYSLFNLEIICIKDPDLDLTSTINIYRSKFYNIKIIDYEDQEYFFNKKITEANGKYILLTDLNFLISTQFTKTLNEIFNNVLKDDFDIILFGLKKFLIGKKKEVLENTEYIRPNELTIDQLYKLYKSDCNILISGSFINKIADKKIKKLSYEPLTYLDLLINARKICLVDKLSNEDNITIEFNTKNNSDFSDIKNKIKLLLEGTPKIVNNNEIIRFEKNGNKNKHPIISIIIPTYNPKTKDIQKLMISLFNQTFDFNNLEIIFINDQSQKRKGIELIEKYSLEYPNIHLYHTPVNSGAGIARNIGLDNAKGKYIMFLDHDDYFLSNACEVLYNNIKNENDIEIVQGNYIRSYWNYTRIKWSDFGIYDYKSIVTTINEKENYLRTNHGVWLLIIRKSFLDKNNIRFKDYRIAQDTQFIYQCMLRDSKVAFINEPIIVYEQRKPTKKDEGSKTLQFNIENVISVINVRNEICEMYDNYAPEYKYIILNSIEYITDYFLLNTYMDFNEFKKYVDTSSKFYNEYLNNENTKKYPKIEKLCRSIAKKDYTFAFREYIKQYYLKRV